ncbi:MAG: hypothetical protein IPI67_14265 [Myxococcales bacterium]|nr:hypothetical protein [Myxococcales bacterium]
MLFFPGVALAKPSPAIEYSAPQGCPDERQFFAVVASHLRGDSSGLDLPTVVEVVQDESGSTARIEFVDSVGVKSIRELHAPTCGEVAAAAALVVALAIDTQHAAPPASALTPTPTPVPTAAPLTVRASPTGLPPRDRVRRTPKRRDVYLELGAGGFAEQAVAPDPLLGGNAFFGLGDKSAAWNLRGRVAYARSGVVVNGEQQARFSLLAGGLDVCVWPLVSGQRWAVQPCAAGELGRVESEGLDTVGYAPVRRDTTWGAAGPLLRVQGELETLRVEAFGGPWIPFAGTRSFVFEGPDGGTEFHRVPWVGWLGGVNLALRLD